MTVNKVDAYCLNVSSCNKLISALSMKLSALLQHLSSTEMMEGVKQKHHILYDMHQNLILVPIYIKVQGAIKYKVLWNSSICAATKFV